MSGERVNVDLERIFELISAGYSIAKACRKVGITSISRYFRAVRDQGKRVNALEAMADRARFLAEEAIFIADTDSSPRARNRIQSRQWYAARCNPKELGDHMMSVTASVDISLRIAMERAEKRVNGVVKPVSAFQLQAELRLPMRPAPSNDLDDEEDIDPITGEMDDDPIGWPRCV